MALQTPQKIMFCNAYFFHRKMSPPCKILIPLPENYSPARKFNSLSLTTIFSEHGTQPIETKGLFLLYGDIGRGKDKSCLIRHVLNRGNILINFGLRGGIWWHGQVRA